MCGDPHVSPVHCLEDGDDDDDGVSPPVTALREGPESGTPRRWGRRGAWERRHVGYRSLVTFSFTRRVSKDRPFPGLPLHRAQNRKRMQEAALRSAPG